MTAIFVQGFLLQAGLILALGAQNVFVLHSGLRRRRHLLVATVSSLCDTVLVLVGVLGVASIYVRLPWLKIGLGLIGVVFLAFYGLRKLWESSSAPGSEETEHRPVNTRQVVLVALAFSLLNPHVYLDTIVLIGGYSAKFPRFTDRLAFGLGASSFSVLWFFGLVTLASAGNRLIHNVRAMRAIAVVSGVVLLALSIKLGMDVAGWIRAGI